MALKVDVFYDFACPWCYVGYLRCQEAIRIYNKEIDLIEHPYMIDTGTAQDGEDYLKYNTRRWGSDGWVYDLKRSGKGDGATFQNWKTWPNTFHAHRLMHYARKMNIPKLQDLQLALFHCCYEEGGNISSIETLSSIGEMFGLIGAKEVLESDQFKQDVIREDQYAKNELGIHGVPYFIINEKCVLEGANPPSAFVSVFEKLAKSGMDN